MEKNCGDVWINLTYTHMYVKQQTEQYKNKTRQ